MMFILCLLRSIVTMLVAPAATAAAPSREKPVLLKFRATDLPLPAGRPHMALPAQVALPRKILAPAIEEAGGALVRRAREVNRATLTSTRALPPEPDRVIKPAVRKVTGNVFHPPQGRAHGATAMTQALAVATPAHLTALADQASRHWNCIVPW